MKKDQFHQIVKDTLKQLKERYPFIYPNISDVEYYIKHISKGKSVDLNLMVDYLLSKENTEVEE